MSDFKHSTVTYTSVPSSVEDYSDIGSPEVDGPLSPYYMPGQEEPKQTPLSSDYYMPPEDDVFPAEEQPLPAAATPTADSPGYIPEFDPNGDPEEDEEEDPEEDLADYPANSTVVALPAVDHVPSEEVTKQLSQIPSPPLPIPSPLPDSPTHIEIPKSCLPLQKRLHFASLPLVWRSGKVQQPRERESRMAREAWGLSMDTIDTAHLDVMSLRTTLVVQHALILDLQPIDRRRQGVIKELLAADHKRQVQLTKALRLLKGLQTQIIEFQRHHGPTKGLAQPDAPGEAVSSS
nr:hypothetical protein [Tanacetum cinerariifolium]